ncbi:heat shock protein beta-1 [Notolabrus celidotus]|uniref:heat shock protein beta-1 n=1 Tax=Notolabrus celidotus TaxID=1203425 RepID=UPI00149047BA|nr:heat shock protein beta-1 [Notolabrus celidotus]
MGVPWYPPRKWWQSSRLFSQDVGLPPFLEPRDPRWLDVERVQRSLAACSWPGYIPAPLFVPYIAAPMHHPEQMTSKEQYKWWVNLDMAHFSPSEISLRVSDGFLEVGGKHEERPDEHGFITRCFTRKYRLPAEIDVTKIASTLSVDGILTVEAPVPDTSVPAVIIIPIKVEMEAAGDKKRAEEAPDTDPDSCSAPDGPDSTCAEADGDESPLEVCGDQAQPGSSAAGLQQHEERREQEEETCEKPAGALLLSEPAHDEGTEGFQDSLKHGEALESQEDQDISKQPENKETGMDGENQEMEGSDMAEEITQLEESGLNKGLPGEVLSQELEAPDMKQEHTK